MRLLLMLLVAAAAAGGCRHRPLATVPAAPPPVVESVAFEGFEVLPVRVLERFRGDFPVEPGDRLTPADEQAGGTRAVEVLQDHGYPYAQVRLVREPGTGGGIRLLVGAEPGPRGIFGRVDITGNRRVDDAMIRRRMAYHPGDLFRRSAIARTQQQVGALGQFESIEIRAVDIDARPALVPTLITVAERRPWEWNLSLGYAAGERVAIDGRISRLSVFGAARRLDLEGRVSRIERGGEITLTQTDAWHPSLSWSVLARLREIDERSFFVQSRGGQAAVGWQWTPALSTLASFAVAGERSRVASGLEALAGLQDGVLNAWSLDIDERRSASGGAAAGEPPRLGRSLLLHLEQAGGWLPGSYHYANVIAEARLYRPAAQGRLLLAGRLRYGAIEPFAADADIPLIKRFFLGGAEEMRGWGIYEISPLSPSGEAVGGKTLFSATAELRAALFPRVTAAVFVEAGQVWRDPWAFDAADLLYDAGPGVRVATPFGLLRFDVGYQLKRLDGLLIDGRPQERRWRVNFGIGEAF